MANLMANLKKEWEKKFFLTEKAGGQEAFNYAMKTYDNDVCVLFTSETCGVFIDEDGVWSAEDLKDYIKSNDLGNSFPAQYVGQYFEITNKYDASEKVFAEDIVDQYGLNEYVDDILERMVELGQFSELKDIGQ